MAKIEFPYKLPQALRRIQRCLSGDADVALKRLSRAKAFYGT